MYDTNAETIKHNIKSNFNVVATKIIRAISHRIDVEEEKSQSSSRYCDKLFRTFKKRKTRGRLSKWNSQYVESLWYRVEKTQSSECCGCASHRSQLDLIKYVFLSSANLGGEDFEYLNESIEIRYDRREFNYKEKRPTWFIHTVAMKIENLSNSLTSFSFSPSID